MLFLLLPIFLFALEINVDYGRDKAPYEILTLIDDSKFRCKIDKNKTLVKCIFNKIPSTPVFKDKTRFFKINPEFKKNFILKIEVKTKFKLFAFEDNFYNNPLITPFKIKNSKKWVIIANYNFVNNKFNGLKFYYHHSFLPYVKAIDENLRPVNLENNEDIMKFFEILKSYKKGLDVTDEIDYFIKRYPNSIFLSDALYLKLKILDKNNNYEEIIKIGKKWIKNFAFNEKLPEVLLMVGKAYSQIGFLSEASYYYNRIINDYPNTKYSNLAMIYLADQLYTTGDDKKALKLYQQVLYSTTNLDIASLAAARLAQRYISKGNIKKAIEYYKKIYNANKKFLLKNKNKAYELANMLADYKIYDLAINIGQDILKKLKKLDDLYEPLLYKLALWSYEEKNYKQALTFIDRYLKEFPYGEFSDNAKSMRDKILFELPENNLTKKLLRVEKIIKNYEGEIKQKAIVKKVKILFKLKKYKEILQLEKDLKNVNDKLFPNKKEFLKKVKTEYVKELLSKNKCFEALKILKNNKIILDKKWDDKVYTCAMKSRYFNIASIICNKYLNSPDDKIFIKWMKRKIDTLWALKDYKNIPPSVDDLCHVMKKGCYKFLKYKFLSLWQLQKYKEAFLTVKKLEKFDNVENIDIFYKIVQYALENKNYLLAATYSKKIIDMQNKYKVYPYSPFVEFTFAKYSQNKKEAIRVLKDLLKRVKGENKAKTLFMLANLTKNKKYIDECLKVKNSNIWKNLCKDAKNLF